MARRRPPMAHRAAEDDNFGTDYRYTGWPRPRRHERAQLLLAAAAEALVLGLFFALFLFGLPLIAAVLP